MYITGARTGSCKLFAILLGICMYWSCKRHFQSKARSSLLPLAITGPDTSNMNHTKVGTTRPNQPSTLGQETVRIQNPAGLPRRILNYSVKNSDATMPLDQFEDLDINVSEHCKRLWARKYASLSSTEKQSP